jgi:hypothetical protein
VRENRNGNQEWTIQRNWQHWVHKTQDKGKRKPNEQSRMDNPTKLATLGTQDTGQFFGLSILDCLFGFL